TTWSVTFPVWAALAPAPRLAAVLAPVDVFWLAPAGCGTSVCVAAGWLPSIVPVFPPAFWSGADGEGVGVVGCWSGGISVVLSQATALTCRQGNWDASTSRMK